MKSHACTWPSCQKSFTRAEHLRRHALNHEQARNGYTCDRCSVHFHRPDLLSRHMMRHAKRDEEAGGPGLGVLETRKRTRRVDGTIVTRPPKRLSRQIKALSSSSSVSVTSSLDHHTQVQAPVSPPGSAEDVDRDPGSSLSLDDPDDPDPMLAPMMPGGPFEPYVEPIPGQFDAADGSWSAGFGGDLDFFSTDTATDFNLPFAATHNYNWLFDVSSLDDAFHPFDVPLAPDLVPFADGLDLAPDPILNLNLDLDLHVSSFEPDGSSVLLQAASYVERSSPTLSRRLDPTTNSNPLSDLDWMTTPAIEPTLPLALPQLTDDARRGILTLIAQSPPVGIHGQPTTLDSPLLSLHSLQSYSDLFFTRFNTTYPLIHTPTFDPNAIDPVFLAALLSMGATYSTREAHQLAVGIHDSLRNQMFCHGAFSPQPELWVLQAMLLIDCFGKMRAGPKQRERAQLFHCVLIKLIRRSNCCSIRSGTNLPGTGTGNGVGSEGVEEQWRNAMDNEQRKRLALQCFMWDTQHAVLFSQSLCMSAFEIRSSLPCSAGAWEAATPGEWARHASKENEHGFLNVLKGYITPGVVSRPRDQNGLGRLVVLHGLMSVSADLKRRDQTTLRAEMPERVGAWRPRMGRGYDLWKADFDADCLAMKLGGLGTSNTGAGEEGRRLTGLKSAALALYRAASLALHVEVLDLQIAAGAREILGRTVTSEDRERSRRVLDRWLGGELMEASGAARHAACLLQEALLSLHDWEQTDAFHFPWCLYLATLTCWAFHTRRAETQKVPTDLSSLIVAMTTCPSATELASLAGQFETKALVRGMAQQLATVRWAVVHDAMKVLVNLAS